MANTKVKAEQLEAAQTNITSLGTLTSLTISGDLTVDTSTLKVDSSNNRVGIGTGSPAYETQIYSADDTVLSVVSGGSNSASLYLGDSVATRGRLTYNNNGDYLAIYTDNNERVRIDSVGNVGIGITAPSDYYSKNLVVMADGDGTGGITIAAPATDDTVYLAFADGTSGAAQYAGYVGYAHNTDDILLGAGGGTRLTLDSSSAGFSGTITAAGGAANNNDDANILTLSASQHARLLVDTSSTSGHRASLVLESDSNETVLWNTGSSSGLDVSAGDFTLDVAGNISLDADDTGHVRFKDGGTQYASIYKSSSNAIIDTTGDFTIDAVGAVTLDSDTGKINFKDGGTTVMEIEKTPDDVRFYSAVQDKAIKFLGNDGNVAITALTIDIANGGRVGIGTTSVDAKLHVEEAGEPGATGTLILEANSSSRQIRIAPPSNAANGYIDYRGGNLLFKDDGTEVARFQGSTSFDVNSGNIRVGAAGGNATAIVQGSSGAGSTNQPGSDLQLKGGSGGGTGGSKVRIFTAPGGSSGTSESAAVERMTILESGLVGINDTTPEHDLHVKTAGSNTNGILKVGGSDTTLGLEITYDQSGATSTTIVANPTYTNVNSVMKLAVDGNANADQLVLMGNGKIGIGTANPTTKLQVKAGSTEEDVILLEDNSGTDVGAIKIHGGAFVMKGKNASAPIQLQTHDGNEDIEVDPDGFIKFETAGAERMRIRDNGYVDITGASDLRVTLGSQGTAGNNDSNWIRGRDTHLFYNSASGDHVWEVGGSETMKLSSGGNFSVTQSAIIGAASNATALYSTTSLTGVGLYDTNAYSSCGAHIEVALDGDTGWAPIYLNKWDWSSGDDARWMSFGVNGFGTDSATISYDGTNFAIVNGSDYRLKENIVDYSGGLAKIEQLQVRSYNKKEGVSKDITQEGFIAHEAALANIPGLVLGEKDAMKVDESGETVPDYQTINREALIPYLVSAIQELTARVKELENK